MSPANRVDCSLDPLTGEQLQHTLNSTREPEGLSIMGGSRHHTLSRQHLASGANRRIPHHPPGDTRHRVQTDASVTIRPPILSARQSRPNGETGGLSIMGWVGISAGRAKR